MEAYESLNNHMHMEPYMEAIRNSKESFVRPKQLIWYGGTDRQTHTQTHTQTDPYIELRYAQLKNKLFYITQERVRQRRCEGNFQFAFPLTWPIGLCLLGDSTLG